MKKLYIDDLRRPPDESFVLVKDTAEAIEWVTLNGCPDVISFDYCLAHGKNVMPFILWLIEQDKKTPFFPNGFQFDVHSSSSFGCAEIKRVLGGYLAFRSKPPVDL